MHNIYHEYSWPSVLDAVKDLEIDPAKPLVLVDSDFIVYPTAFSPVCLQGVEAAQEAARMKLIASLAAVPKDATILQFFTSKGGPKYRDQFYESVPYKANRKTGPTPQYVEEIKQELFKHSISITCDPVVGEADDYIAMFGNLMHKCYAGACIVGQDKDLLQIPGKHFRGVSPIYVDGIKADRFLYRQILSGDAADNIKGLMNVGPSRAKSLIPDFIIDEEEMFSIVVREYMKRLGDVMTEDEITNYLFETANLLYLRRDFDDHWSPPC
jgi:hypothetical protein